MPRAYYDIYVVEGCVSLTIMSPVVQSAYALLLPVRVAARRIGMADRLCMAHFAIIVFGVAALIGPDADAMTLAVMFGLLTFLLCCLPIVRRGAWAEIRVILVSALSNLSTQQTLHHMLAFYRRASRLAGAPPVQSQSVYSVSHRGGSRLAFTSVCFPKRRI